MMLVNLLRLLPHETAHLITIKLLKSNLNLNRKYSKIYKSLNQTILGINFKNPIGLAAGFDKNAEVINQMFAYGFGFIEVGTVTPQKQYGNPKPRVFRLVEDQALINRLGFNNLGSKNIVNRIKSNTQTGLLGVNIGPNKNTENRLDDYIECLKTFHHVADYVTINISSPNTEDLRSFHDTTKLNELLKTINEEKKNLHSKIPIAVKVSPDIKDQEIDKISEVLLNNNFIS